MTMSWRRRETGKAYRDKGKRETTIKTVYGEVSICPESLPDRMHEDGRTAYVYLLDEAMSDGKDRADLHKSRRKDRPDRNGDPLTVSTQM